MSYNAVSILSSDVFEENAQGGWLAGELREGACDNEAGAAVACVKCTFIFIGIDENAIPLVGMDEVTLMADEATGVLAIGDQVTSDYGNTILLEPAIVAAAVDISALAVGTTHVKGSLTITRAAAETQLTGYNLYWGSAPQDKLEGEDIIAAFEKTGADIAYTFAAGTAIPDGASYLMVYTENYGIEHPVGISVELKV